MTLVNLKDLGIWQSITDVMRHHDAGVCALVTGELQFLYISTRGYPMQAGCISCWF